MSGEVVTTYRVRWCWAIEVFKDGRSLGFVGPDNEVTNIFAAVHYGDRISAESDAEKLQAGCEPGIEHRATEHGLGG